VKKTLLLFAAALLFVSTTTLSTTQKIMPICPDTGCHLR